MSNIKTSYVHGAAVAKATNPVGDNYVANFTRGFALYYDPDVRAIRDAEIAKDREAFKAYLLAKS